MSRWPAANGQEREGLTLAAEGGTSLVTFRDEAYLASSGADGRKADNHFVKGPPKDLVVVRGASVYDGYKKIRGKLLKVEALEHLRSEIQELNTFLDGFVLEHGAHRGFFRGYNNADRPSLISTEAAGSTARAKRAIRTSPVRSASS